MIDTVHELVLLRVRGELARRYAISTAQISLHYATAVMRAAFRTRRIPRDVTTNVSPPRRRDGETDGVVTAEAVPTRDEFVAILAGTPERYRAAVALGGCGLRIGEVLGATVGRFDLEAGTMTVDRQLLRVGNEYRIALPKREKRRTIKLPSWARFEVRRHLRDNGPFTPLEPGGVEGDGLLFRGGRGAPMRRDDAYRSFWWPALRAAGLGDDRFKFHSLRHWCASSLLAEGAPITAVAGHLGDTVETVSRTYLHWLRDDRDVPADVLDRLLAKRGVAEASEG